MIAFRVLVIFIGIFGFIQNGYSFELSKQLCRSVSTEFEINKSTRDLNLEIILTNNSVIDMSFEAYSLYENMIQLEAIKLIDGEAIARSIPLLSPGIAKILIEPGESYTVLINLYRAFPTLKKELFLSDVNFNLAFSLDNEENCFMTTVESSVLIKKNKTQ